jgi:hypothetical protein
LIFTVEYRSVKGITPTAISISLNYQWGDFERWRDAALFFRNTKIPALEFQR